MKNPIFLICFKNRIFFQPEHELLKQSLFQKYQSTNTPYIVLRNWNTMLHTFCSLYKHVVGCLRTLHAEKDEHRG